MIAPDPAPMAGYGDVVVPLVAALFMMSVGFVPCLWPGATALRVNPTDALRAE